MSGQIPAKERSQMASRYGTIEVKRMRGTLDLVGLGRTGRGQQYIKRTVPINAPGIKDPAFKSALEQAVKDLTADIQA